jgi:small GTP-binding protein
LAKKVCLIGDFAVGKTSLIARFVNNVFSDKYLTTIGVKIDTKDVTTASHGAVKLVIWDIAGKDVLSTTDYAYVRGASGLLVVADGTRAHTLTTAERLKSSAESVIGEVPVVLLVNKSDLGELWEIPEAKIRSLKEEQRWNVFLTSAKTGTHVERAFMALTQAMVTD